MSATIAADRLRPLEQSITFAVRALLDREDDPLALATYLWVVQTHRRPLLHGDRLANWGRRWVRQVLMDGQTGRRRDDDITAAALAAIALTPAAFANETDAIRAGLAGASVPSRDGVPFGRAAYAAAVLLAASVYRVDEAVVVEAAKSTVAATLASVGSRRAFGLGFALLLAQRYPERISLAGVGDRLIAALDDPEADYEDRLYLVQALWLLPRSSLAEAERVRQAEDVVETAPAWSALMNGLEDLRPLGDGRTPVPVSHLYRATLLDVLLRLEVAASALAAAEMADRTRRQRLIPISAFILIMAIQMAVWAALLWTLLSFADQAYRFWLLQERDPALRQPAVLFVVGAIAASLALRLTLSLTATWWQLTIRSGVVEDAQIWRGIGQAIHGVWQDWRALVLYPVIIGIIFIFLASVGPRLFVEP